MEPNYFNPFVSKEKWEQEYCVCGGDDPTKATLIPPFRPDLPIISYRWRCPRCRTGWVTEGSAIDKYNESMHALDLLEKAAEE